jgi:hypothetical protein
MPLIVIGFGNFCLVSEFELSSLQDVWKKTSEKIRKNLNRTIFFMD